MAYKLICIDVDGTLLNSKGEVTEASKKALFEAHRQGVHIVISTGRMYSDAEYFSNFIGLKSPVIASNGAFVKERDKDKAIFKDVLGEDLSLELLNVFHKHKVRPYFCTPQKFYYGNILFKAFYVINQILGRRSNRIDMEFVFSWNNWRRVICKEKDNIVKCEIIYKDPALICDLRSELQTMQQLEIVDSSKYNIEITRKGVSKGKAVQMLASLYNIKREEIMTIGDSRNDLSMIEYAGLGVAMGNADDVVKEKADYVTDSNDNDGVAKAINKFVLDAKR